MSAAVDVIPPSRQSHASAHVSRLHSDAPSRPSSNHSNSALVLAPFGFRSKTMYDAGSSLTNLRSENSFVRPAPALDDVWRRPPPDFRPQCYVPQPPKRNSREAVQPWRYGTQPGERPAKRPQAALRLPQLLIQQEAEPEKFVTTFDVPGAWEGKLAFVKDGMYKAGPYRMPRPHDFRGYPPIASLGLPEFHTDYERDPYNLRFLSDRLDILPGEGQVNQDMREVKGQQMAPPMTPPLQWDARLILPHEPFPNKFRGYTRFRPTDRGPHSALMDRVEDKLTAEWAKAKLERELTMVTSNKPKLVRELTMVTSDKPKLERELTMVTSNRPKLERELTMVTSRQQHRATKPAELNTDDKKTDSSPLNTDNPSGSESSSKD